MSEKSEKCAREIEALLREEGLHIDGGELRDILAEEFEGGDAPCTTNICEEQKTSSTAKETSNLNSRTSEGAEKVQSSSAPPDKTKPRDYSFEGTIERLEQERDKRDEQEAEYIDKMTKELQAQIADRKRLREELLAAKNKAYTDYRDYVGLVGQNEGLHRQIDELNKAVDALRRKLAESRGEA